MLVKVGGIEIPVAVVILERASLKFFFGRTWDRWARALHNNGQDGSLYMILS